MTVLQWIKWHIIVGISIITGKTVVRFFGSSYIVSGNIIKKLG